MRVPFPRHGTGLFPLFFASVFALSTGSAAEDYFGRNKVQYERFNFHVLTTDHYSVYFYPREEAAVRDAARMAERWYARYSAMFNYELRKRNPIIFYGSDADFQQTNVVYDMISEGVGGVTEGTKQRVVMPLSGSYSDIDHVLGHELVHMFQYDIDRGSTSFSESGGIDNLPLWFIEGMPEYFTLGRNDSHTAMWMRDAVLHNAVPKISDLANESKYFPYRWGQALWAYIGGRWGDDIIPRMYRQGLVLGWEAALTRTLGMNAKTLSAEWNAALKEYYAPLMQDRTPPDKIGRRIRVDSDMNIGPAVSPDGSRVAFLSQRDIFTIDLFLADTRTGKIIRKLSSSERERHFDALRFIDSAGSWSPDGRRFAFVVFDKGDNKIVIVGADNGCVRHEISSSSIDAMYNPAWSPDGETIVFSGLHGGISDLYRYSFRDHSIRRLTDDRYADLQPAWSPDGRTIAFVTDRGPETDFARLTYAPMRIALMDADGGNIRLLSLFGGGDVHTNPQFSPDGRSLYFVADHEGFQDIFRTDLETGAIFRVTHVATGVSGITTLSPALSVSPGNGLVVFSVFQKTKYVLYELRPEDATGTRIDPTAGTRAAALLPPADAYGQGRVYASLNDPDRGLPPDGAFPERVYKPSLKLDYVGLPSIGITADRYGTQFGGGIGALFSDMLGDHVLGIDLAVNGSFSDFGAQTYYINRNQRLNWGIVGSRIPYLSQTITADPTTVTIGGQQYSAVELEQVLEKVYVSTLGFSAEYPFDSSRRLDLHAGVLRLDYENESERIIVVDDEIISDVITTLDAPSSLNLFQTSVGLTGDNSYFGFTSPVRGMRYHLSIQPTFGSLQFQEVIADFRRYFFTPRFTFAFRFLHYGYYGKDAQNSRLSPFFIGYETLVRGYELDTFDATDCTDSDGECTYPEFTRLLGSRMAVMNLEFRVPLFGVPQYGIFTTRYLPMDLVAFADAGTAWSDGNRPTLRNISPHSTERIPVFSAGAATRLNILNLIVLQIYWAYPFQHPTERGHFGFLIAPGW